jgi:hypothetical protein
MSASQVQIVNLAFQKFGNVSISAITDTTPQARFANALWDIIRDELTSSHAWNFAMKRVVLSTPSVTTDPLEEYDYIYTLPADCLRVWKLLGTDANYSVEGGVLMISDEEVKLKYIAQITDVSLWPPAFVRCMATALAAELCIKMEAGNDRSNGFKQELKDIDIPFAQMLNAFETNPKAEKGVQDLSVGNLSWQKREG